MVNIEKESVIVKKISSLYNKDNVFFHFSDVDRPDVYVAQKSSDIFGLYGFPFSLGTVFGDYITPAMFHTRKYIHFFEFYGNKLEVIKYTKNDLYKDLNKINKIHKIEKKDINFSNLYFFTLFNLIQNITNKDSKKASKIYKYLNYDFIEDFGSGSLAFSEPYQAVSIIANGEKKYKHLLTVDNHYLYKFIKYKTNNVILTKKDLEIINKIDSLPSESDFDDNFNIKILRDKIENYPKLNDQHVPIILQALQSDLSFLKGEIKRKLDLSVFGVCEFFKGLYEFGLFGFIDFEKSNLLIKEFLKEDHLREKLNTALNSNNENHRIVAERIFEKEN